ARQFVLHRHVLVGDRIVDVPSYIVEKSMEDSVKLKKDLVVLKHSSSKGSTKEKENG
ncbi:MAG: 30S ribosomal protein S4, partial [Candidatus Altiarchaeales archaeon]